MRMLLRPLPYVHPDRLATIQADLRTRRVFNFPWPGGDLLDVKQQLTAFESIAGHQLRARRRSSATMEKPNRSWLRALHRTFSRLLGTKIAFGRNFVEADGTAESAPYGSA
jgi:hypothetical protein